MCDNISTHLDVTVGVPQGSVLGPQLLILSTCLLSIKLKCVYSQMTSMSEAAFARSEKTEMMIKKKKTKDD